MMIPIPFYGWLEIDQDDKETMLREQIHAQQAEIKALRTALMYANPAKELTNEEIMKVANEIFDTYKNWGYYQIDFARAILRKASEK